MIVVSDSSETVSIMITKISNIIVWISAIFFFCKNYAFWTYLEMKFRNHSINPKKNFKSRKLDENRKAIIILTFFSKINILNESTRCSNRVIEKNLKKNLFENNDARLFRNNWKNWRKWNTCSSKILLKTMILFTNAWTKSRNDLKMTSV